MCEWARTLKDREKNAFFCASLLTFYPRYIANMLFYFDNIIFSLTLKIYRLKKMIRYFCSWTLRIVHGLWRYSNLPGHIAKAKQSISNLAHVHIKRTYLCFLLYLAHLKILDLFFFFMSVISLTSSVFNFYFKNNYP